MQNAPLLYIQHEPNARFEHIGTYGPDRQFMAFVTGAFPGPSLLPFSDDILQRKSWNAVLHHFDLEGNHIRSDIKQGGYDRDGRQRAINAARDHLDEWLAKLSQHQLTFTNIQIKPFSMLKDDVYYQLVHDTEDDEQTQSMTLWPNDIMFHPPWDSGNYST